ncbi:MAG: hypothetical protein OXM55_08540 [Bdellovibrionales bacterium]|nr:hypothetical protein [Bdellovibrionales bacterium]
MGKYEAPKNRAKRHAELRKQSLERPGVKEMMTVYNLWKESHKAEQAHQAIKDSSYTVTNSDSSEPRFF